MVALEYTPRLTCYDADERRIFGRVDTHFQVEARRLDHSLAALRQNRLALNVRDLSLSGMSGLSNQPLEEGERLAVRFPPRNHMPAWIGFGRVVRCEPSSMGYHLAVEFDTLPAA